MNIYTKLFLTILLAVTLVSCGDESSSSEVCPAIAGEQHIAQAMVTPSGSKAMLHLVGRACALTGDNQFKAYPVDSEMSETMAPPEAPMASDFVIQSVAANMPAMGHGTAEPATLNTDDPASFAVAFQMPGSWEIEVKFLSASTGTTEQTALFLLEVQ